MDISKRYSIELNKISNHLADLERGHIYELTKAPGTPSCATLAQHLKEDIAALLDLIENDKRLLMTSFQRAIRPNAEISSTSFSSMSALISFLIFSACSSRAFCWAAIASSFSIRFFNILSVMVCSPFLRPCPGRL